jgi:hypothetical protein
LADVGKDGKMILKFTLKKEDGIEVEWREVTLVKVVLVDMDINFQIL